MSSHTKALYQGEIRLLEGCRVTGWREEVDSKVAQKL